MKQVIPLTIESGLSATGRHVLTLCDPQEGTLLPISIGKHEAHGLLLAKNGTPTPRPMPHQLMANVLEAFGISLACATIDRVHEGIFFATLHVSDGFNTKTIDSRATDAVTLAILSGAPIYADERVLEECGVKTTDPQPKPDADRTVESLTEELHLCEAEENYERAAEIQAILDRLADAPQPENQNPNRHEL